MKNWLHRVAVLVLVPLAVPALGHGTVLAGNIKPVSPDSHAPIGVMGDHRHKAGEWMLSYRFMGMNMDGNLRGDNNVSAEDIVTTVVNPFSGPATVRVVPNKMTTSMHMFGLMYAPSDQITLMAMLNYVDKEMDHTTFSGMVGTQRLGFFNTSSTGMGDTKISALWGLYSTAAHKVHLNLGLSIPTGSIDEKDTVLAPTGMRMSLIMPYAMQLGSGTFDLEPGITYNGYDGPIAWGAQYRASLRLGENSEDYRLGNRHKVSAWSSVRPLSWLSTSLRLSYSHEDAIDGNDPRITAPVSTANPDNYGGERVDVGLGVNIVGQSGMLRGHRLALEYEVPISQKVNGVQMEMESMLTVGYQYAF